MSKNRVDAGHQIRVCSLRNLFMMKLTAIVTLLFAACVALAQRDQFVASVTFDQTFDNPEGSLDTVACSSGANGLETLGFKTFGSLPSFPFIGGAPNVTGFNSAECGTCWGLQFDGVTINVLAIDVASTFNIALEAMNTLTSGQAEALGRVTVAAFPIPDTSPFECVNVRTNFLGSIF